VPQTFQIGKKGEEQATTFLKESGYEILHINWRYKHLEIDIIAKNNDFLVIVEVKTRKNADFGAPETFVSKAKQRKIIRAANEFVAANGIENEIRFDIISVNNQTNQIEHIERAFYPGFK
jgi:putative endonuclease